MSSPSSEYTFIPRNYVLGIINGATFMAAMSLFSPTTVGAMFIAELTDKKAVVGLMYSLMMVGWSWPQMIISHMLEHRPFKKPFYVVSAVLRILVLGLVLLAITLVGNRNKTLLLCAYGLLMFSFSSLGGIGIIPFMDIVSKTMPPNRRGAFFAYRRLYAGVLGIGGGYFVQFILKEELGIPYPTNFLIIFGAAFLLMAISSVCFCFASEPAGHVAPHTMGFRQRLRRGWRIFRKDRNYRRLYLARSALALGGMATPIYAVYAVKDLGAPVSQTGMFILIGAISATVTTVVWKRIGDVHGNRLLMLAAAFLTLAAPFVASVCGAMPASSDGSNPALTLYLLVFAFASPAMAANGIAATNYLLEIAPETRRPTYVGFMYTIAAPLAFCGWLGGWLADVTSPELVFILAQACTVVAIFLVWRIDEPRKSRQLASRYVRWESSLRADGIVAPKAEPARSRKGG